MTTFIKAIDQYSGRVDYGTVIKETSCYITVEIKKYYSNGNSLVTKLFKRDGAMYNHTSINFYIIQPEKV